MKRIYLTLIAMILSNTGMTQEKTLYPWLAKSGKYGYCDSSGKNIITTRFDDAQPFKNGYAVVAENGRYGIIDQHQQTIIPMKYPSAQFFSHGLFNLLITRKQYNAWWRIRQWRLMPEFNILSTRHRGPFLVTKVPVSKWKVVSVPDNKVLFCQKQMEADNSQYWKKDWYPDQHAPADMQISSSGNVLKVHDQVFVLNADHKLKKVAGHVVELVNDTVALVFKGGKYFTLDLTGKSTKKVTYVMQDSVAFQVKPGVTVYVEKQSKEMYPYPTISTFIFKANDGRTYLSPDLSKPLPTHVEDYINATAAEIMEQVITLASIPGSPYFLVLSVFGANKERKCLLLDSDGKWNTSIPAYEGLDQLLINGDLLFTRGNQKGILTTDLKFTDLPIDYRAFPLTFSKNHYSGKDIVTQKYGIYNTSKREWQVPSRYSFIGNEIVPGSCIYTEIKENGKEYYGLVDINTHQEITPSIYDKINNDGRVSITEHGRQIHFYINPITGKEYRE